MITSRPKLAALLAALAVLLLALGANVASAAGYTVTKKTASAWMAGYLDAWETRDADAVEKLFTPNGTTSRSPG